MPTERLSNQIKRVREILGMTQAQLAERAGTTQQEINLIELGKVDPRLSTLLRLAEALGSDLYSELKPKQRLEKLLREQALKKARLLVGISAGSSALEQQLPKRSRVENKVEEVAKRLLEKERRFLWK